MKIKECQQYLKKKKLDGLILFYKDPNFFYFVQEKIDNSILIIPTKGKPFLFKGPLEKPKTKIKKITYKKPYEDLKRSLKKKQLKKIGINESQIILRQYQKLADFLNMEDFGTELSSLRITKTKEEIRKMRKACKLTEEILKDIINNFKFKTEEDIRKFIRIQALEKNCKLSFEPVVANAKNAAIPHYSGNSKIKKGFLIIDLGLKYKGYCSDITRTFYIGTPTTKEKELYDKLLSVQKKAINLVEPGKKISDIAARTRKLLGKDEKYFTHSLGHGLGINVHEKPNVSNKSEELLEEGMVITIEPGLYNKTGIRIEDDVLITPKGKKVLSKHGKELIIIPKV